MAANVVAANVANVNPHCIRCRGEGEALSSTTKENEVWKKLNNMQSTVYFLLLLLLCEICLFVYIVLNVLVCVFVKKAK